VKYRSAEMLRASTRAKGKDRAFVASLQPRTWIEQHAKRFFQAGAERFPFATREGKRRVVVFAAVDSRSG